MRRLKQRRRGMRENVWNGCFACGGAQAFVAALHFVRFGVRGCLLEWLGQRALIEEAAAGESAAGCLRF